MLYPQTTQRYFVANNQRWRRRHGRRLRREHPQGVFSWWNTLLDRLAFKSWQSRQFQEAYSKIVLDRLLSLGVNSAFWDAPPCERRYVEETLVDSDRNRQVRTSLAVQAYRDGNPDSLISVETSSDNTGLMDFSAFIAECPEKFFALIARLRPEFQEIAIEYHLLHKSQTFIGKTHNFIQTRTWQTLRIIERAIGAFIVLGLEPKYHELLDIITIAGIEHTPYGSLTDMIVLYAKTQSYAEVAKWAGVPTPTIRKIFRPAIATLTASKNLREVAVGSYLRNLTHHASLTKSGLSKRCIARLRRVRKQRFTAPATNLSPLIEVGDTSRLRDTPWFMFEISSDQQLDRIAPILRTQAPRLFGKRAAAQIFAPVDEKGDLEFGYIMARGTVSARVLLRVRGISEVVSTYDDEGNFKEAVRVPNADVQQLIKTRVKVKPEKIRVDDFVQILAGDASNYCGIVTQSKPDSAVVRVKFPTNREFLVTAHPSALKKLGTSAFRAPVSLPVARCAFWGIWKGAI